MKLTKGNLNQMNNKGKSVKHYKKKKTFRRKKEMHGKTMKRLRNNVYFGGEVLYNFDQTFNKLSNEYRNKYENLTKKEKKNITKSFDELIKGPFAEHINNENRILRLSNFIQVEVDKTKPSAPVPKEAEPSPSVATAIPLSEKQDASQAVATQIPLSDNSDMPTNKSDAQNAIPILESEPVPDKTVVDGVPEVKKPSIFSWSSNTDKKPSNNPTPTGTVTDVKNPVQPNNKTDSNNNNNNNTNNSNNNINDSNAELGIAARPFEEYIAKDVLKTLNDTRLTNEDAKNQTTAAAINMANPSAPDDNTDASTTNNSSSTNNPSATNLNATNSQTNTNQSPNSSIPQKAFDSIVEKSNQTIEILKGMLSNYKKPVS